MTIRPEIGDVVEMSSMGADVHIRIRSIPDDQPDAATGTFTIVDQYGDKHRIDRDCETWVTCVEGAL